MLIYIFEIIVLNDISDELVKQKILEMKILIESFKKKFGQLLYEIAK